MKKNRYSKTNDGWKCLLCDNFKSNSREIVLSHINYNHEGGKMIETDETEKGQFIKDKTLGESIREVEAMFKKKELRPLERQVIILYLAQRHDIMINLSHFDTHLRGSMETMIERLTKHFGGRM